ncbi:MAG: agmatinase [Bacteroidales bacterium]|jgi:agmatinase|nr:agmatinase [Bacteroidales bacterium]
MFDPNAALEPNGNYFGFPFSLEESKLILISVPWDVTASYKSGTAKGPQAIMDASLQLDFYDEVIPNAWELGIGTLPLNDSAAIRRSSIELRDLSSDLSLVNAACSHLNEWVFETSDYWLGKNKKVGIVGGEHSVPLGYLQALAKRYDNFGILHFDAHADLRDGYEGLEFSHASIMYNALKILQVERLVQVGIRDVSPREMDIAKAQGNRVVQFSDRMLQNSLFNGSTWHEQCEKIISTLPEKIYISFDIDALDPSLCPHTGTPVPSGISFAQVRYFLEMLQLSKKEIIGFDLCEVAPAEGDEWDGNVGARVLYMLSNACLLQNV